MTAPAWASTTVTDFGSDATTHNANMPATVNAGDMLIAIAAFDDTASITTPTGWTKIIETNSGSTALLAAIYARVADGTEGGTTVNFVTADSQRGSVHAIRITGAVRDTGPIRVAACAGMGTGSFMQLYAGPRDVIAIAAQAKSSATAWGAGPPTNYINNTKSGVGEDSTASASIASATRELTNADRVHVGTYWNEATGFDTFLLTIPEVGTVQNHPVVRAA